MSSLPTQKHCSRNSPFFTASSNFPISTRSFPISIQACSNIFYLINNFLLPCLTYTLLTFIAKFIKKFIILPDTFSTECNPIKVLIIILLSLVSDLSLLNISTAFKPVHHLLLVKNLSFIDFHVLSLDSTSVSQTILSILLCLFLLYCLNIGMLSTWLPLKLHSYHRW